MDKIQKLEQRWFTYKAYNLISSLTSVLGIFLMGLLLYVSFFTKIFFEKEFFKDFFKKETVTEKPLVDKNLAIRKPHASLTENNISMVSLAPLKIEKPVVSSVIVEKEIISLSPVIPLIDMDREHVVRVKKRTIKRVTSHKKTVSAKRATFLTSSELKSIQVSRDTTKLKKINLTSSSKNYIETMKEKFFKSKHHRDALLVAKAFYSKGAYKESEKWALKANKLESKKAESWIIFASSKAKMGQKEEAIKILFAYYKKDRSARVKAVIEKIKTGQL